MPKQPDAFTTQAPAQLDRLVICCSITTAWRQSIATCSCSALSVLARSKHTLSDHFEQSPGIGKPYTALGQLYALSGRLSDAEAVLKQVRRYLKRVPIAQIVTQGLFSCVDIDMLIELHELLGHLYEQTGALLRTR